MGRKGRFDGWERANGVQPDCRPPAPVYNTYLSELVAGEGVHAIEQRLRLSDEALGGVLVNRLSGEGGGFEQRGHLAGDAVALGGERSQLVFERAVGGVAGGIALDSRCGDLQAGAREGA